MSTVAVVGGGVAGLTAAWELSGLRHHVVVLEGAERPGGKLGTIDVDGMQVDTGPDGFLARRVEAAELCREIGLGDALRPVGASGATVWARGRARPLPAGLALGVPTRLGPVARSGVLGPTGVARLAVDALVPRTDSRRPLGDRAIGPLIARKLGQRVVDVLVDPLLGGIHAGTVADMSAAATYPQLLVVAQRRGSFMRSLRRATAAEAAAARGDDGATPAPPAPAFWAVEGGQRALVAGLVAALEGRGVSVRTGSPVTALERQGPDTPWMLQTPSGPVTADAVVLAVPAYAASTLLAPHDIEAAKLLSDIDYASVATVTFTFPPDALPDDLYGTGMLVPRTTVLPGGDGRCLISAVTYLSRKWPHLARPDTALVRASVGRIDDRRFADLTDDELVERVVGELTILVGPSGPPSDAVVTRWMDALPQYRVHHLLRVTGVEAAMERLHTVAVAGAALRGVGIPACVASGRAAARQLMSTLPA
jgi:oxygen-dependent protoporphyrinogen oxidase